MGPRGSGAASPWRAAISAISVHTTAERAGGLERCQARLKPSYAGHYPGLPAGVWLNAAEGVALAAPRRRRAEPTLKPRQRLLPEEHFEFRGGAPRGRWWPAVLSRGTDRCVYETD